MHTTLSSLLLVTKEHHAPAVQTGVVISNWLSQRGVTTRQVSSRLDQVAMRAAGQGVDAVLVLGGDGAILGVARALVGLNVPILGVNFGRVGFLAEVTAADWESSLADLLEGKYHIQPHTALRWNVARNGREIAHGWAINDVVAARGEVARAVVLDLIINDIFLSRLHCDGVIISAPLGATAYAASARGPLVFPALDAQIVTPISPFAGAFPPLVLPAATPVCLVVGEGDTRLTVDGQVNLPLELDDKVHVHGVPGHMLLLVRDPDWYLRRVVERGFILAGPGSYAPTPDC